jgi:hypothetical protein
LGGYSRDRGARGHVLRDDGPRAYQRAGADPHTAEDHRPRADARLLLNDGPEQGPVLLSLEPSARPPSRAAACR